MQKHFNKHKKKYTRFTLFFILILSFGIIEDIIAAYLAGGSIGFETLMIAIGLAIIFTLISEITEEYFEKEKPLINLFIKKKK